MKWIICAMVVWFGAQFAQASTASGPSTRPLAVKVAAVQCSSDLGAVDANRKKLMALVEEAAKNGAKIIVLPEAAITGYLSQDLKTNWGLPGWPMENVFQAKSPVGFAETVPGPSTKHFAELAKRLGVYVTVPLVETDGANPAKYYNTVCLAAPTGEIVAHYRKLTPWPYPEKSWATPGDRGVQTFDTEYGRIGLGICFDIHTILEKYQPLHIWALLYPIAWVDGEHPADWFWHRLPERVGPFHHYLIGANWSVDQAQAWRGYGFSEIISPDGKVIVGGEEPIWLGDHLRGDTNGVGEGTFQMITTHCTLWNNKLIRVRPDIACRCLYPLCRVVVQPVEFPFEWIKNAFNRRG